MKQPVSDSEAQPAELHLERTRHLEIVWQDGQRSTIPLLELRRACPCATCRAAREERQRNPLAITQPVENPADGLVVDQAELVGNYALRIRWRDGHDTGIYDFELLRSLAD